MMNRRRLSLIAALALSVFCAPAIPRSSADVTPSVLETTQRQRQAARMVTRFVERAHYAQARVNDDLSSATLDTYIEALDGNRHYFLKADIAYFERYRQRLDDVLRSGDMEPVFDIFRLYRLRAQQHLTYAIGLLETEPDFSLDESYDFNREDLDWLSTPAEVQDLWRKRVKNDALSLLLADKTWDEAREILTKRYDRVLARINELDSDDVFETFLNAFAHTLDPHSSYLSPRQSEEYRIQMSLSYQGIGASLRLDDDFVTVLDVIPGGPAAIDGRIQPNDRITAVAQGDDGEFVDVVGWQLDDVVQLIRGPRGTKVRLQLSPGSAAPGTAAEQIVDLVRDKIKLEEQAAKARVITLPQDGREVRIGVLEVPSFYQDFEARNRGDKDYVSTTRDVRRLLGELEAEGIDGLILDLRGNGGGHLSEAASLTGLFVEGGPIVQLRDTSGRVEVLEDPEPGRVYGGPMAVLVDRFSASASEILAAAIQDYQRGVVIGQQTFGKGTVQNLYVLDQYARSVPDPGLGQLTLTIGKFYRVTGGSTQHRGVVPDIQLPSAVDPAEIGESSRERALPWDQISATRFEAQPALSGAIETLARYQQASVGHDPDFQYLLADIQAAETLRQQRTVSLNLEARRQERETQRLAQLTRENARREAIGLAAVASLDELDPTDQPDILVDNAARLVGEMARIGRGDSAVLTQATDSPAD